MAFRNSKSLAEAELLFLKAVTGDMGVAVSYSEIFFKEFNAKAFFERIIHQMPFGAAVFDMSGMCVLANGVFKKQMGGGSPPTSSATTVYSTTKRSRVKTL